MKLRSVYKERKLDQLELWRSGDWTLKVYSILHQDKDLDAALLMAAKRAAEAILPQPAKSSEHYGVGFMAVHRGASYDFVYVDWWAFETELRHNAFVRASSTSSELESLSGTEMSNDVWDLRLLSFERDAWVETVLRNSEGPDLDAYLQKTLEGVI